MEVAMGECFGAERISSIRPAQVFALASHRREAAGVDLSEPFVLRSEAAARHEA